jgi:hypothetical protein
MKAIMYEQSRLIAHQSQRLVIKEKILSLPGNSFDIKNVDGRVVFRVDGRIIPFSGRKHVRSECRRRASLQHSPKTTSSPYYILL